MIHRRRFLLGCGALLLGGGCRAPGHGRTTTVPIVDTPPSHDDEALRRIFVDNSEPLDDEYVVKGLYDYDLWWDQVPLEEAIWPAQAETIDYAHLPAAAPGRAFELTDTALRRIVASHGYERLARPPELVLFGIRGARPAAGDEAGSTFVEAVRLVETEPDHLHHRCLLGVWNSRSRQVWVTPGSTAPHVAYLFAQREAGTFRNEANMMPTGLYRYRVGTHRNGSRSAQPGAFRPADPAFAVLRCVRDGPITMSQAQFWDLRPSNHGDNLHAGTYSQRPDRPRFWSAGCQVTPGYYDEARLPQGAWARFRVAAGLQRAPTITRETALGDGRFEVETSEDDRPYFYLLTTGRDVLLASAGRSPASLRFGSTGPAVQALQAALELEPDGVFGIGTQTRLLERGRAGVPIATDALAHRLGVRLGRWSGSAGRPGSHPA